MILRRSSIAVATLVLVLLGLGCMKMESLVTVLPNGSAKGSVTVGIMESFWNTSEFMNMSFGNFTMLDTENATVWSEGGWVYIKQEELFIPEDNLTIQIDVLEDYTEYTIEANVSEMQEGASQEDEFNLSDPFTQIFLQQMTFDFAIEMPGEIVDSNAHETTASSAAWSFTGATMMQIDRLYVKSRMYVPEAFLVLAALPGAALLVSRKRGFRAG
jgi:hypothetical protein